jgi:hypothetical protein
MAAPPGLARVEGFCEAFFSYLERGVLQGGCFFVAAAAEFDAKPGPVKDHLGAVYAGILSALTEAVHEAQAMGEIGAAEDVAQLVFELDALLLGANFAYVFFDDPPSLERARRGVRARLERARPTTPGVTPSSSAAVRPSSRRRASPRTPPAAGSR